MQRQDINPWTWQDEFGFVQAISVNVPQRQLICSGQTSVDADGHPLHAGDMASQIAQSLDNLATVLSQAGFQMSDVVRLNYYTTDVDGFLAAAGVVGQRIAETGCRAASTLLGVTRLAFPERLIEIEATAMA